MFRLISAKRDYWRYQALLHFAYVELAIDEMIRLGYAPSDVLLDSFAMTAAGAAESGLGVVASA